ncbi:MAG: hypothetical protein JXM70_17505 [Pirellulales bacterium]|nr:hypothetical protein [Pirellulales bacterium]
MGKQTGFATEIFFEAEMEYAALATILLTISFGMAILEVFFPSGGLLGFLSIASLVGAAILGFQSGPYVGVGVLGTGLIGLPVVLIVALKYLPSTRMGRKLLLGAPTSDEVLPHGKREDFLKSLIGQRGVAKTMMLPAGAVTIEHRTIDAVSEGMVIDSGQAVEVIEVRGNRVVVRSVEEDEPDSTPGDEDPLSRSFDSLGIEPFDE